MCVMSENSQLTILPDVFGILLQWATVISYYKVLYSNILSRLSARL